MALGNKCQMEANSYRRRTCYPESSKDRLFDSSKLRHMREAAVRSESEKSTWLTPFCCFLCMAIDNQASASGSSEKVDSIDWQALRSESLRPGGFKEKRIEIWCVQLHFNQARELKMAKATSTACRKICGSLR